eukprot:2043535-Amphidinium_carterae.2
MNSGVPSIRIYSVMTQTASVDLTAVRQSSAGALKWRLVECTRATECKGTVTLVADAQVSVGLDDVREVLQVHKGSDNPDDTSRPLASSCCGRHSRCAGLFPGSPPSPSVGCPAGYIMVMVVKRGRRSVWHGNEFTSTTIILNRLNHELFAGQDPARCPSGCRPNSLQLMQCVRDLLIKGEDLVVDAGVAEVRKLVPCAQDQDAMLCPCPSH